MRTLTLSILPALALLLLVGAASPARAATLCRPAQLQASFTPVPGSPGAGNVVYRLRVRNASSHACALEASRPAAVLWDSRRRALPTHASFHLLKRALLRPGQALTATARFSPDVPGVGEQHPGPCERTAAWLRLRFRGLVVVAVIRPRTPVCEKGSLPFSSWSFVG